MKGPVTRLAGASRRPLPPGRGEEWRDLATAHLRLWGRGRREAPGEGTFHKTLCLIAVVYALATPALAAPVANPIASFAGLDKITARITDFDVYLNEAVQFGSLQITPRACYTQPANDTQQRTAVFVEVNQVSLKGATERIFTGWMFADSPALNAIDDPVYDFWLVDCKQTTDLPPPTAINPEPTPDQTPPRRPLPKATTAGAQPAKADLPAPAEAPAAPAGPVASESGSIITLIDPKPTAETSPDR